MALLAGCAGNLAIRDYAQERRVASATQRLEQQIELENSQELATRGYLAEARSPQPGHPGPRQGASDAATVPIEHAREANSLAPGR